MAQAPAFDAPEILTDGTPEFDRAAAERVAFVITVRNPDDPAAPAPYGVPCKVLVLNIPMMTKAIFVKATKTPWEQIAENFEDYGEVGMCMIWFMARLCAGEWPLTWQQVCEQWPTPLGPGDVDFSVDDGELTTDLAVLDPEA